MPILQRAAFQGPSRWRSGNRERAKERSILLWQENGQSLKDLAESSGLSLRMIRQYEQGARDIRKASVSELFALAEVLHCSVEDQEFRTGAVALKCFSVQQPPVIIIVVLLLYHLNTENAPNRGCQQKSTNMFKTKKAENVDFTTFPLSEKVVRGDLN